MGETSKWCPSRNWIEDKLLDFEVCDSPVFGLELAFMNIAFPGLLNRSHIGSLEFLVRS